MVLKRLEQAFRPSDINLSGMFYLRKNFMLLMSVIIIVTALIGSGIQFLNQDYEQILGNVQTVAAAALGGYLTLKNRINAAAFFLFFPLLIGTLFIPISSALFIVSLLVVIGSAVTLPVTLFLIISAIVLLRFAYEFVQLIAENGLTFSNEAGVVTTYLIALLTVMGVTRYLIDTAVRLNRDSLRTAELLHGTSQVSQLLSGTLSQEELFSRAVEAIRDRFAFYHVQIFTVDEQRQYANLVASTGDVGQRLLTRGHRLAVGSKSVIGRVTQIGEPVLARDDDRDTVHMVNEFLPYTRSELALPLIDNDRIIGALDVQSTRPNAFTPSDIQALLTLAGQLTTAIRNARLFEQQHENVQQNQQLLLQAQGSLREIQRLNTQLNHRAWEEYLNEQQDEVGVKIDNDHTTAQTEWTTRMTEAALTQRVSTGEDSDHVITAVPIILRGELLGVIEVEGEHLRDEDVVEMVQAVAQNLATTLDSVRLLEEVQTSAAQEQRISAINDRYQSAASVDELMRVTLEELAQTLGADEGTIRLSNYGQQLPSSDLNKHRPTLPTNESPNGVKFGTNGINGTNGTHHANGSAKSAGAAGMNGTNHSN